MNWSWKNTVTTVGCSVAAAFGVFALVFFLSRAAVQGNKQTTLRETACVQAGGQWVTGNCVGVQVK